MVTKTLFLNANVMLRKDCLFHAKEAATRGVLEKKGDLRNFAKFTEKHLCKILFFNKVESLF